MTNNSVIHTAAFFAQQAYNEPILGHYVEYNNQEYIRILSSHNNASGFDGDVYLNTSTKQIIVTFRGTEFGINEQGYLDALKADVMGFGSGSIPAQYYDAKNLLDQAINILNSGEYYCNATGETYTFSSNSSNLMIVGHSLDGGLAQLLGAQEGYKNYRVETFNSVGAQEIVNRNPGLQIATNHNNITNHVITRDYVSTIFDQIGTVNCYKPATQYQLSSSDFLNLNFLKLGENKTYPIFSALSKIKNAHTILNFTDPSSFQPADNNYTYQSLVSIIRKYEGESIIIDDFAPILTPLITIGFGIAYAGKKGYQKIFRTGAFTGGAASIEPSNTVIQGGISYIDIQDEIDYVCKVFVDNEYKFVSVAIDTDDNLALILEKNEININNIDSIVQQYKYFETYYNNMEIIYNKNFKLDTIYIYKNGDFSVEYIQNILVQLSSLNIAIINENENNGNSTIIGDNNDNIIYGKDGKDIIFGGNGNDFLIAGGSTVTDEIIKDISTNKEELDTSLFETDTSQNTLLGGAGNDILIGDNGNDILFGGNGSDYIYGGDGADIIFGGNGNDFIFGGQDYDTLIGGIGYDKYTFSHNNNFNIIYDSDGKGCVIDDDVQLKGAIVEEHNSWIDEFGNLYEWSGQAYTTLSIITASGNFIVIPEFYNSKLDINLGYFRKCEVPPCSDDNGPVSASSQGISNPAIKYSYYFFQGETVPPTPKEPIVFDLNNDGFLGTTSVNNGVYFDYDGDGFAPNKICKFKKSKLASVA